MISGGARPDHRCRGRIYASCTVFFLLAAACATAPPAPTSPKPRGTFILLPEDDGKIGKIVVTNPKGTVLLSKPRETLTIDASGTPGKTFIMSEKQVSDLVEPARSALPSPPMRFIFYFKFDSAVLTEASREKIPEVLRIVHARAPVDISVVGHTDTVGEKDYNYKLSYKRAEAVANLLAAEGVNPSILEVASHGKDNPLVPTGNQVPEPRNRRVEVTVR